MSLKSIDFDAGLRRLADRKIEFDLTEAAKAEVVREGYDPAYGARPLRRTVQRRIENELAKRVLAGEFHEGEKIIVDFGDGSYAFRAEPGTPRPAEASGDDGVIEGEVVEIA